MDRYKKADRVKVTLYATIRPSYGDLDTILREVQEMMETYSGSHDIFADDWNVYGEVIGETTWDYGPEEEGET